MPLTPVFGLDVSGGLAFAPSPAVLQFPGVPQLSGNFGGSIGVSGVGVNVGASVGFGGVSGGLSVSGGIDIATGADLSGGISGGISLGGGGGIPGGITGGLSGGLSIGPGGISGGLSGSLSGGIGPFSGSISLSPFGLSLSAGLAPLMTEDDPSGMFPGPSWGVFDQDGDEVCTWESVLKVDYRHEMRVSDFPIEDGDFASYNKVQVPYDARITFVAGGLSGVEGRTDMLVDLEDAVASLDLYTVVTPDATYRLANLTHMDYSRETRRGVTLLVVEIWLQEIRLTATATVQPQSPTADSPKNSGQTQAKDATVQPALPEAQRFPNAASPQPAGSGGAPDRAPPPNVPTYQPPDMPGEAIPPPQAAPNPGANAPAAVQAAPYRDLIF